MVIWNARDGLPADSPGRESVQPSSTSHSSRADSNSGVRVVIVDPGISTKGGHHYNSVMRLKSELELLGAPPLCFGSRFADESIVQDLALVPLFSRSVYSRKQWSRFEFKRHVSKTTRELRSALARLPPADLIILPTCDQVLALALANVLEKMAEPRPHVVIWLLFAPHYKKAVDDPSVDGLWQEYREAFAALSACLGDVEKLAIHCETNAMADAYEAATGINVNVVAAPNLVYAPSMPKVRQRPNPSPVVLCCGHANEPKGYRLLPGAIASVLHEHAGVRFLIHGIVEGSDAKADAAIFDDLARLSDRVTVTRNILSPDDYVSLLNMADLVLLPYDPVVYRARGSGLFTEATTLGIPVVVPRDCNFAEQAVNEGRAVGIEAYGPGGVSQAILQALSSLDSLSEHAQAFAIQRRHAHEIGAILAKALSVAGKGKNGVSLKPSDLKPITPLRLLRDFIGGS